MKKLILAATIAAAIITAPIAAAAKDVLMKDVLVKDVVTAYTKNDKEYVRIILAEERALDGVKYTVGVPMMVFETDMIEVAKGIEPGATKSFVADKGSYQGRTSYTLRAFVE